ncbi:metallophosphoesterase [Tropicimonas sp. TH_r6]|uniref:metallophosphoesterase n=1 Tax=Tropicimonas sp. TH_r6 TaxID=3082085 RepID=UPI002954A346|nr:metallophosphoesterase [Tropicimonas sp. TH_r6]MDV7145318.1 metallophosphoesterase [Tropicimonas sp. TH_r6]
MTTLSNWTSTAPLPLTCTDPTGPREIEPWPVAALHSGAGTAAALGDVIASLKSARAHGPWQWPERPVVFLSDTHADFESFLRSLATAGAIHRHGSGPRDFRLTGFGERAQIVIGGDCLDKGPSNLDMLDALAALLALKPDTHLLAGNHDLRLRLAILGMTGPRGPLTEHLFLRMGRKLLPLLREIWERDLAGGPGLAGIPDNAACRRLLIPGEDWFETFPREAGRYLAPSAIAKEIRRLREKRRSFEADLEAAGLALRHVVAAGIRCRKLFLEPEGEYGWFYARMEAACRIGSLLFVHAGIDDEICTLLAREGVAAVNARYRHEEQAHPLGFYFGSVANLARTKYRESDRPLSPAGVAALHGIGVKMVVHGHVNNHAGQRLLARGGLLHLQGDVTLDRASRLREGLRGIGAGATLVLPSGDVLGLSSDYPRAKHFNPAGRPWEHADA